MKEEIRQPVTKNKLTELYKFTPKTPGDADAGDFQNQLVLKISADGSSTSSEAKYYTFNDDLKNEILRVTGKTTLEELTSEEIADLFKDGGARAQIISANGPYILNNLTEV